MTETPCPVVTSFQSAKYKLLWWVYNQLMLRYIAFSFKTIALVIIILITTVLQFSPLIREYGQLQNSWLWTQIKSTYPDTKESISESGMKIVYVCTLDSRDSIFGSPLPFYKYEGSSSCGNTYISLFGLLTNLALFGISFWLIVKLLKKF